MTGCTVVCEHVRGTDVAFLTADALTVWRTATVSTVWRPLPVHYAWLCCFLGALSSLACCRDHCLRPSSCYVVITKLMASCSAPLTFPYMWGMQLCVLLVALAWLHWSLQGGGRRMSVSARCNAGLVALVSLGRWGEGVCQRLMQRWRRLQMLRNAERLGFASILLLFCLLSRLFVRAWAVTAEVRSRRGVAVLTIGRRHCGTAGAASCW